ncbi:MAG: hypothetical protein PF904_11720 [Kiritimatiellae bacterium]|nr:hypothetical protein [Kiritimatiellia bacterium]
MKVQSGTWAFTQTSTFAGSCTIEDGGAALINGTAAGCPGAGRVVVMPGGILGGTGVVSSTDSVLQYPGATISPGDPSVNDGIGCLTYNSEAGLDGVSLICQVNSEINDFIKINAATPIPGFMKIEIIAASAEECPDTLCIIEATSLSGITDLSGWEISGPCTYIAAIEGNTVVLHKMPPPDSDDWGRSMRISFKGYQGTSTLTNFPALIKVWDGCGNNRFHYTDCEEEGVDLLFKDATGMLLSHEIETWNTNGESHIWVRIPELTRETEITAYWKNSAWAADANPFVPTDLLDCDLWLHAGAGLATNSAGLVSRWSDQSGNAHDAVQANSNYQPCWTNAVVNGLPGLRFDGVSNKDGLTTGWGTSNGTYSVFVAATYRTNSGYTWHRVIQGANNYNWGIELNGSAGNFYSFVPNGAGGSGFYSITSTNIRPPNGTPFVAALIGDGMNTQFTLNGFGYSPVEHHHGPGTLILGTGGQSGNGWSGHIFEVVAYDRALSYEERCQVERYLAIKYDSLSAHRVPSAGLQQWIRGDYVVADELHGSTPHVSKCENQVSGSMHAYQTASNRMPELVSSSFNGKPALRFDAVSGEYDSLKSFASAIEGIYSIITVYNTCATNSGERIVLQGAGSVNRLGVANGSATYQSKDTVSQLLPCQTNIPVIATMVCNGIASRFYINGVNLTQDSSHYAGWGPNGSTANGVFYFGAGTADSALDLPLDGDLAEVLVYNRALSDTERRRVEAYLSVRYAIPVDTSNADVWSSEFNGVWHFTGIDRLLLADASTAQNGSVLLGQSDPVEEDAFAGKGAVWNLASQMGLSRTQPETDPQTFSFWVKQQNPVADQAFVLKGTSGQSYAALNNVDGKLQVADTAAASLVTPMTDSWIHYAVVTDPSDQSVQVYGNGQAVTTIPDALAQNLPTEQALIFGHAAVTSNATKTFSGTLDEVRLETVHRSADWIKASYMTQAENERFTGYNHWGTLIILH